MSKALSQSVTHSWCSINAGFLPQPKLTARISLHRGQTGQTGIFGGARESWQEQGSARRAIWGLKGEIQGDVGTAHQRIRTAFVHMVHTTCHVLTYSSPVCWYHYKPLKKMKK